MDTIRQPHKSWSTRELKTLKKLWESGSHITVIMRTLKVTKNSVIGKATRMGYIRKESSPASPPPAKKKKKSTAPGWNFAKGVKNKSSHTPHAPLYTPQEFFPLPGTTPTTLDKLDRHQCRFPFGHTPDMTFCGCKVQEGKPYCPNHYAITMIPPRNEIITVPPESKEHYYDTQNIFT